MEVIIGIIFVGSLLLVVGLALQPGFENLALAQRNQQFEDQQREAIREVGLAACQEIDAIIARYGQLVDQSLAETEVDVSDRLEVFQFSDNDFNSR